MHDIMWTEKTTSSRTSLGVYAVSSMTGVEAKRGVQFSVDPFGVDGEEKCCTAYLRRVGVFPVVTVVSMYDPQSLDLVTSAQT